MLPRTPRSTLFPYTTLFRSKKLPSGSYNSSTYGPSALEFLLPYAEQGNISKMFDVTLASGGSDGTGGPDRKSTRLNSSHEWISYAVFCLKKKKKNKEKIVI